MSVPLDRARSQQRRANAESLRRPERPFRWMYLADAVGLFCLMVLITSIRFGSTWPNYSTSSYLIGFAIATIIHLVVAYFGGMYDRENRLGSPSRMAKAATVSIIAVLIDAAASLGAEPFLMPRLNLAIFAIASMLLLSANRSIAKRMRTSRFGRPRVLLVGSPDDIALAESHLAETDREAVVVGRWTSDSDLETAIEENDASDVLLVSETTLGDIYPHPLAALERRHIGVYVRLFPQDTLLGVRTTVHIAGMPFVVLRSHALPQSKVHLKRLLDLVYIAVASPLIALVFALILLYARIFAGSPTIFRQERVGRHGESFKMLKFRTMYLGAEDQTGPTLAERNDPRVIPAMSWTRSTRVDELPQLWNVIRGDMSLVGPRPERPELAQQFEHLIPGYGRRHDIRPGLTGLAQVNGDYHTDPGYKLGHDLQYLVNWSPMDDLHILLRTVVVVARGTR